RLPFRGDRALGVGLDPGEPFGEALPQQRQVGDRNPVLARQRAQGEKPLFDRFERAGIKLQRPRHRGQRGEGFLGLGGGALLRRARAAPRGPAQATMPGPGRGARRSRGGARASPPSPPPPPPIPPTASAIVSPSRSAFCSKRRRATRRSSSPASGLSASNSACS